MLSANSNWSKCGACTIQSSTHEPAPHLPNSSPPPALMVSGHQKALSQSLRLSHELGVSRSPFGRCCRNIPGPRPSFLLSSMWSRVPVIFPSYKRALENIYKLYKLPKDQRELRLNAWLAPFIDGPVLVPRDEKTCLGSVAGFVSFHLSCISFLPADVVKTPRLQGGQRTVCGSRFSLMQAPGVELPSNLLPPTRLPPPKVPPSPNIGPLSGEQCSNP